MISKGVSSQDVAEPLAGLRAPFPVSNRATGRWHPRADSIDAHEVGYFELESISDVTMPMIS